MTGRLMAALAAALVLPAPAALAHVEITPKRAAAGSEARLTLVVENERPAAATRRIDVQLPAGITSVAGRRLHGWRLTTRGNRRATLTAGPGRELRGDEQERFGLLVGLPARPGATLVFKLLQTYDNGEVVRWIGPPGASEPAPRLRLGTAAAQEQPAQTQTQEQTQPQGTTGADQPAQDEGDDSSGPPIWAGIGLIVLAALAGTMAARARNRRRMRR